MIYLMYLDQGKIPLVYTVPCGLWTRSPSVTLWYAAVVMGR